MTDLVPISALFFDGPGPHIVRAGFAPNAPPRPAPTSEKYTPARGTELRALLDTSIAQLGGVSGEVRRKTPVPLPPPVAIETLFYRGRSALDRALEIRETAIASGRPLEPDTVKELLDLIGLAAAG